MAHLTIPGEPHPMPRKSYSSRPWGDSLQRALRNFVCASCGASGPEAVLRVDPTLNAITCRCGGVTGWTPDEPAVEKRRGR